MDGLSLIDQVVLVGIVVVLPLALGGRWWPWLLAGGAAGAALRLDRGPVAAGLAAPWVAVAVGRVVAAGRRAGPLMFWARADVIRVIAAAYAVVAAAALVQSRAGVDLFGVREPIVELTAVHFTFAGCGALVLAGATRSGWAVVLTAAAPPIVATGFVTGWAAPQVGGAVLMTAGVWTTAALQLREAAATSGPGRVLLAVSGVAIWAPMVLAVGWAAGQHWSVPYLSLQDMVRYHGVPNALGFTVAGLLARRQGHGVPGEAPGARGARRILL